MDQGSLQGSENTNPSGFAAPMGGSIGDGGFRTSDPLPGGSVGGTPAAMTPGTNPYPNPTAGMYQQQQQQQPSPYGGGYASAQAPPPATAPPPPGSYAARSAHAHAQYTFGQPSVSVATPTPGSYASRSQQTYQQQHQTPSTFAQPSPPSPYGGGPTLSYAATAVSSASSSYAARSQQAYGNSVPASVGPTIASPPPAGYPYPSKPPPTTPRQQQLQQSSYASPAPVANPQGGYAARSAQAYASATGEQPLPPASVTVQSPFVAPRSDASVATPVTTATGLTPSLAQTPQAQAVQQRLLTDATRKVQEHAYYMRQAMDQNNLPSVLERAAYMAGELGVPPHGHYHQQSQGTGALTLSNTGISAKLTPKNYYELYMRALEDMPSFEDYLLGLSGNSSNPAMAAAEPQQGSGYFGGQTVLPPPPPPSSFTMRELYDCIQYCPRVLSRLYLQISAGSALIRSGEVGSKWVLNDLIQCVKCEQNPIRGLFLRNHLLTVLRDKLPDTPAPAEGDGRQGEVDIQDPGNVVDSYEFVMENFMEMNKLWVRLQYMPGDGNTKEVKKRRERERNDLRILVGTNLVRISQLEGVTSKIYGEAILPRILDHVVVVGDPLSQAYLMDCLVQVFPDEYHIETLPILLNVCPRLRDKVNIRTILQGLMDRLANYLADKELLDESDTNQVKLTLARDSFGMFDECVQKVYNARGPKLTSKEVIRLQTALLQFSLKCYPGNTEQIARCMGACVSALKQANASFDFNDAGAGGSSMPKSLDDVSVAELEKLLSIPLESLALRVLELDNYSELIGFLPWANRRAVAKSMLEAVDKEGAPPKDLKKIAQLFSVITPLIRREGSPKDGQDPAARTTSLLAGLCMVDSPAAATTLDFVDSFDEVITQEIEQECSLVSKLVHLLDHEDADVVYEMLSMAREQIRHGSGKRACKTLVAVVFAGIKLSRRIRKIETVPPAVPEEEANGISPDVVKEDKAEAEEKEETEESSIKKPEEAETAVEEEKEEKVEETKEEGPGDVASELKRGLLGLGDKNPEDGDALFGNDEEEVIVPESKNEEEEEEPLANGVEQKPAEKSPEKKKNQVSSRQVFLFMQETIVLIGKANPETSIKLLLEVSLAADSFAIGEGAAIYAPVAYELLAQSYSTYEQAISDPNAQKRIITAMIGTLLSAKSLSENDYEALITKTAQFSARLSKKPDQCQIVAQCAHLFFPVNGASTYSNPQRALECLQRSLKVADACTATNPAHMTLFVDLLEHYVFFLENKTPSVTASYVTGLCALVKEYLRNATDARAVSDARNHYLALTREIQRKKAVEPTASLFAAVHVDVAGV